MEGKIAIRYLLLCHRNDYILLKEEPDTIRDEKFASNTPENPPLIQVQRQLQQSLCSFKRQQVLSLWANMSLSNQCRQNK